MYTVAEQFFEYIWVYGAFLLHLCDYKVNYFYSVSKGWELALKPKKFCRNFCRIYLLEYIRKEIHRKIDHFAMNFFFLYFSINKWLFQLCFICHIKIWFVNCLFTFRVIMMWHVQSIKNIYPLNLYLLLPILSPPQHHVVSIMMTVGTQK